MRTIVDRTVLPLDSLRSELLKAPTKEKREEIVMEKMSEGGIYPVYETGPLTMRVFQRLLDKGKVVMARHDLSEHFTAL